MLLENYLRQKQMFLGEITILSPRINSHTLQVITIDRIDLLIHVRILQCNYFLYVKDIFSVTVNSIFQILLKGTLSLFDINLSHAAHLIV